MSRLKKAAVTGWPVDHSRSPVIHGYWLKKYGIEGSYVARAVPPETAFSFYRDFAGSGLVGCNVTVPHKEVAARACDILDEAAQAMGAANTLWLDDDGRLHGSNTDGLGFLGNLDQQAPGWDRKAGSAVVLGAGGAARAIVWALLERKFTTVHIVNRTLQKARDIQETFGSQTIAHSWDNLGKILDNASVLVNTTALGMTGKDPLRVDLSPLPVSALVTDIVYVPVETELLKQARQRGNPVVDGLGMLLHQAVPGFEKWFGRQPEVDETVRDLVLKDMGVAP
ncbi:MAG: shikimate dehydrogenase [Roseibium sp.]|nr:shikimate dehydrogenase [Roseibium sp.]